MRLPALVTKDPLQFQNPWFTCSGNSGDPRQELAIIYSIIVSY